MAHGFRSGRRIRCRNPSIRFAAPPPSGAESDARIKSMPSGVVPAVRGASTIDPLKPTGSRTSSIRRAAAGGRPAARSASRPRCGNFRAWRWCHGRAAGLPGTRRHRHNRRHAPSPPPAGPVRPRRGKGAHDPPDIANPLGVGAADADEGPCIGVGKTGAPRSEAARAGGNFTVQAGPDPAAALIDDVHVAQQDGAKIAGEETAVDAWPRRSSAAVGA